MEQAFFRSVQGHVSLQPVTNEVNLGYWYRTIGHRGILYSIFQEKKCDLLSEKYDKAICNKLKVYTEIESKRNILTENTLLICRVFKLAQNCTSSFLFKYCICQNIPNHSLLLNGNGSTAHSMTST
jgi:hypothetical protein